MFSISLFGIPIRVQGWFWVSCFLLGRGYEASGAEDWIDLLVWTWVVFVSIVAHEMGHALAGRRYGATPIIELHGLGGVTYLPGGHFSRKQSIFVSAAGPLAGFLLGAVTLLVYYLCRQSQLPLLFALLGYSLYVNFLWSLFNLLPILPMDGGQILRDILGPRHFRTTCMIGCVLAAGLAIVAAQKGYIFTAVMLGFFAYGNFQGTTGPGGVVKG